MNVEQPTRRAVLQAGMTGTAFLVGSALVAACGSKDPQPTASTAQTTPVAGGSLRVGLTGGGSTETLDPHKQLLAPDLVRSFALYAYVGEIDGTGKPRPLLAESVEMADKTGAVWDIRLKQELEFHNGKTVTADDLLFSLRRMLDPKLQSSAPLLLPWVTSAGLAKVDPRTVRVTLQRPVSIFDQALFNFLTTVVPADFDPAKPVGAGPFKFESFSAGDRSVFTRFANYADTPAYADRLEIISFSDDAALVNALLGGEIDVAGGISAASAAVAEQGGVAIVETPSMGWQPLTMRVDVAPFDNPKVREAFRLIADRPQLVKQVYSGRGAVRNDMYGWDSPGYPVEAVQRAQDIEKAKALLAEAGASGLKVELHTTAAQPGQVELCQVFAEQAKAAGVTVSVVNSPPDVYYTKHYLQAAFASDTFLNVPYLNNTLQAQLATSPYNATHWADPEFVGLYDKLLSTADAGARDSLVEQMQTIQQERGALIIGASYHGLDAVRKGVNGLREGERWAYPMNGYHLERVWLG